MSKYLLLPSFLLVFLAANAAQARAIDPFTLPQMNSAIDLGTFSTNDYTDAVYIIETYQLRCSYCNINAPQMASLAVFYNNEPRAKFIDLGLDQADRDYAQWISRHNVQHYVLKDASRAVFADLGTTATPTTYILDASLNIVWEHEGVWTQSNVEEMKSVIDGLLAR